MQKSIYLDNNATTPLDLRVFEAMKPYFEIFYGNPASQLHHKGWDAKEAVEIARKKVAQLIQAHPSEIAFTAGSTESNNWAIKGLVDFLKEQKPDEPIHVLTSNIEHASVKEPLLDLKRKSLIEVDFLPVDSEGFLSLETLQKHVRPTTKLISLIWVHNEIGTIQNLKEISLWAQTQNIFVHTDATQAVGKIEVNLQEIPLSLLSFSAHKLYGPKGVGALYVRKHPTTVNIRPLLHGGGQESLGRSGTLNVPSIVGLGEACALAKLDMKKDWKEASILMEEFWKKLKADFPQIKLNGPEVGIRTAYNLNITLFGIQGSEILPLIQELCVSGGSACSSGNLQGNPVLLALGHNPNDPSVSLRISAGRMTTALDFEGAFAILSKALNTLDFNKRKQGSLRDATMLK